MGNELATARLVRDLAVLEALQQAVSEASDDADIIWDENDKSASLNVSDGGKTVKRNVPINLTTDGIRAKVGYNSGIHVWEITWPRNQRGPFASVGIATFKSTLKYIGGTDLIGGNNESVGWNLSRKVGLYNDRVLSKYPENKPDSFVIPDKIVVVLDMNHGVLRFLANDEDLGICASGLRTKQTKWYPAISTDINATVGIRKIQLEPALSAARSLCAPTSSEPAREQGDEILDLMKKTIREMNNPQASSVVETRELIESLVWHFHGLLDAEQKQGFGDKFAELHGVKGIVKLYGYVQKAGLKDPEKTQLDDAMLSLCFNLSESSLKFCEDMGKCGILEALCNDLQRLKTSYKTNTDSERKLQLKLALLSNCSRALSIKAVYHTKTVHDTLVEFCSKMHSIYVRIYATDALSYVDNPVRDTEPDILQKVVTMLKVCTESGDHIFSDKESAISTSGKKLLECITNVGSSKKNRKCLVDCDVCSTIVWFLKNGDNSEKEQAANCISILTDESTRWNISSTNDLVESLALLKDTDNDALKQASHKALQNLEFVQGKAGSERTSCNTRQLAIRLKQFLDLDDAYFNDAHDLCYCTVCHGERGDRLYYSRGVPSRDYGLPTGWFRFGLRLPARANAKDIDACNKWHRAFHGTKKETLTSMLETGYLLPPGDTPLDEARLRERKEDRVPEGLDRPTKHVLLSPSIHYAGHNSFATPFVFVDEKKRKTYIAKVGFSVFIRPGSYEIGEQTVGATEQIDPRFGNQELEWSTKERGSTILYGLLVKIAESPF